MKKEVGSGLDASVRLRNCWNATNLKCVENRGSWARAPVPDIEMSQRMPSW